MWQEPAFSLVLGAGRLDEQWTSALPRAARRALALARVRGGRAGAVRGRGSFLGARMGARRSQAFGPFPTQGSNKESHAFSRQRLCQKDGGGAGTATGESEIGSMPWESQQSLQEAGPYYSSKEDPGPPGEWRQVFVGRMRGASRSSSCAISPRPTSGSPECLHVGGRPRSTPKPQFDFGAHEVIRPFWPPAIL